MDVIEQLQQLQDEPTARGLRSEISDKAHWFPLDLIPALTCCLCLGHAQVTVTGHYRWLNGNGTYKTHPRILVDSVVDDRIRTRVGTGSPPEPPERKSPLKRPPLPRRSRARCDERRPS
ncbi:hypothetical protein [Nocardiopsis tropica]|uniref:Transposase n=1 Tax=Nocardiopsis tropica TaxID=109330 RepID=A0ABU7KIZ9_9ACTN|nr:hypothetical protein [Nocardiopsis umidischolae]MEE2049262.1 hypothetical protein [Nocardiopsis umidischolae]